MLERDAHALGHRLHDPEIGLVRNEPANLFRLAPGLLEAFLRRAVHRADRLAVNLLAGHFDERSGDGLSDAKD